MSARNTVSSIPLTSVASVSLVGTYAPINTTGLPNACFMLRLTNSTDVGVTVSFDGVTNNEYIPAGGVVNLPVQSNSQYNNFIANFPRGTIVYVKGTAGMTGSIYLSGYYQGI